MVLGQPIPVLNPCESHLIIYRLLSTLEHHLCYTRELCVPRYVLVVSAGELNCMYVLRKTHLAIVAKRGKLDNLGRKDRFGIFVRRLVDQLPRLLPLKDECWDAIPPLCEAKYPCTYLACLFC
jgi:hypothetical protein